MRDVLKAILLHRLRDQPAINRYPSHILSLIQSSLSPSFAPWIAETSLKRRSVWSDIYWELLEAEATLKHLHKAKLTSDRRTIKYSLRNGYPIDYLFGHVYFMGQRINVRRPTLIPRPDTEAWVERLLQIDDSFERILEIGTGTGCIAIGLANRLPKTSITAIDICRRAVDLARKNHRENASPPNCMIQRMSTNDLPSGNFDLIISNPPYIPKYDRVTKVSPNVRRWESSQALHADLDGTAMHRSIIDMVARGHLMTNAIALELDGTQKQYRLVQGYAETRLPAYKPFPLTDGQRKFRAIVLKNVVK